VIHAEGIGSIINRFENEEDQNVETFNHFFPNCKLTGFEPHLTVTIGEYNKGRRAVTIGDNITLDHEFSLIDLTLSLNRLQPFILKHPNGDFIGRFNSFHEASEHMDMAYSTFRNYVAKSKYVIEELTHE
jgi:hypothetical protein